MTGMKMAATPPMKKMRMPMSGLMPRSAMARIIRISTEPKSSSAVQKNGVRMMSAIFSARGRARMSGKKSVRSVYSSASA